LSNRLLIVDDEYYIREGLRQLVAESGLAVVTCAAAEDGNAALKLFAEHSPDIVLLDINLPDISGLEVARRIRETDEETPVLFLTGYESVAFVREAIGVSATDYMLKPITREDLAVGLRKAIDRIGRRKRTEEEIARRVDREIGPDGERALIDLLLERRPVGETLARIRERELPMSGLSPPYAVLVCELDEMPERASGAEGARLFGYAFGKMAVEAAEAAIPSAGAILSRERAAIVLSSASPQMTSEAARRIRGDLARYLDARATIGISRAVERAELLPEAYREAAQAAGRREWVGGGHLIPFDIVHAVEAAGRTLLGKELLLASEIRAGNEGAVSSILREWSEWLGKLPADQVKLIASQMILFVLRVVRGSHRPRPEEDARPDPLLRLAAMRDPAEIVRFAGDCFLDIGRSIRRSRENGVPFMFEQAKKWIRERLHEDVGLNDLARHLHLSPKYVSARFKQVTGESFADYVTRIRFDRSRELLLDPARKVSEVAEAVGFADTNYFSIAFKRHTGLTPTEFRRRYS